VVTYTVTNTGQTASTATTLQGTTPAGATLVSATPSQGTATINANGESFTANLGSVAQNASALVQVVYRANVTGNLVATATASGTEPEVNPPDNTVSTTVVSQTPVIPVPPDTTPPTITELNRFGAGRQPTSIELIFSEAMDQATVQDTANYAMVTPGPDGRFNTRDDVRIPLLFAAYEGGRRAVILQPRRRIPFQQRVQLTVNGSTPTAVADANGNLLDGLGNGLPGSNFVRVFRRFGPGPISSAARAAIRPRPGR
jgi:hypothetical protein